jgi:hypothetical protein
MTPSGSRSWERENATLKRVLDAELEKAALK